MMDYKQYVDGLVDEALEEAIEKYDCLLFEKFCEHTAEQYGIPLTDVRCSVNRVYVYKSLIKRRLNNSLKNFYGLTNIKGCPAVLIK